MDTDIPLFFSEIEYLLLETIPLETIMRVKKGITVYLVVMTLVFIFFLLLAVAWRTVVIFALILILFIVVGRVVVGRSVTTS